MVVGNPMEEGAGAPPLIVIPILQLQGGPTCAAKEIFGSS
jgi:hypothetical protein